MSGNENGVDFTDHVSYRGCRLMYHSTSRSTIDQHIGRYVSRELVEISAQWRFPVSEYGSTDRPTVSRVSIGSVSAMYW